jgi:hypothetical protein
MDLSDLGKDKVATDVSDADVNISAGFQEKK